MKTYLFFVAALFLISSEPAHSFGKKPINPAPAPTPIPTPPPPPATPPVGAGCPAPGSVQAVDLSMPVDQPFLDVMKKIKVNTVIRYYDHLNETIKGKTLRKSEVDLLARNGFDLMVVFQHNNNNISSFTAARGVADATRSLVLAGIHKQDTGSAIYFGVDGDWRSSADLTKIKNYFRNAGPLIRGAGFRMGAYGSGLVCGELLKAGLTDLCWLANAKGWPGYQTFLSSRAWSMVQGLPKTCGGKEGDFNVMNSALRDLGQFRP